MHNGCVLRRLYFSALAHVMVGLDVRLSIVKVMVRVNEL